MTSPNFLLPMETAWRTPKTGARVLLVGEAPNRESAALCELCGGGIGYETPAIQDEPVLTGGSGVLCRHCGGSGREVRRLWALGGRAGNRIADLAGWVSWRTVQRFLTPVNLLAEWPGPSGTGSAFNVAEARKSATRIMAWTMSEDPFVYLLLCGHRVANAFHPYMAAKYPGYFRRMLLSVPGNAEAWAWAIPHPSGVNRWWNDPANERRARRFMRRLLR